MRIGLFIPTYNAGKEFDVVLNSIDRSIKNSGLIIKKIIIDTFSDDDTVKVAKNHNFEIYSIFKEDFTHGEVRRRATEYLKECDFIIFMTQDVVLHENSIEKIVDFIKSRDSMLVAYGRQIPDMNKSTIFEQKSREFNYPNKSLIKSKKDIESLGVKTAFSSDAFSIYRRNLLLNIGSFPSNISYCEDEYVAAKAILDGYLVGYCSESVVTHSNHMNLRQQYKRYKSIGDFHKQNPWIQKEFGSNESEGIKLVVSEWKFLIKNKKAHLIPYSFFLFVVKYLGYRL